ncbi:MAG: TIM barrel protein [Myxococcales bacterium]|nr:TIM barrel protein [Myxococcales bacterium]
MKQPLMERREALLLLAGGAAIAEGCAAEAKTTPRQPRSRRGGSDGRVVRNGRVKQGVALWPWTFKRKVPLENLLAQAAAMGLSSADMVPPQLWQRVRAAGLQVSVGLPLHGGAMSISKGINVRANHDGIVRAFEVMVPRAAAAKVPNLVCSFGNRQPKMSRDEAISNSVACLNRCKGSAEKHGVTLVLEILNSKRDHVGYIGDSSAYALEIIKAVASSHVKLLFDIYHAQVSEGDVTQTIKEQHAWIAHYQIAGNPGRHEIDDSQELNYPSILRAILATGYKGYVVHEFVPTKPDPIASLREAARICDV